jgi:hypothetical protein
VQAEGTFGEPNGFVSELFRAVNDRIRELEGPLSVDCEFVCECSDEACMHVMWMTVLEYDSARSDPAHFAVLPGHQRPASQSVVRRSKRFVLVKDE